MRKKYLIAEGWSHIFFGNDVTETRWALDVARRKLVAGFILRGHWWHPLEGYLLLDLQEDVEHNVLEELDRDSFEWDDYNLKKTNKLPTWALSPSEEHPNWRS